MKPVYKPLSRQTVADVVCLPGQLEIAGKNLLGDISQTVVWRDQMFEAGLQGVVAYANGSPRGFAEFLPAEAAPAPIEAPGASVLMCYHWAGTQPEDPEHLSR